MKKSVLFALFVLLLVPMVSAEILMGQPNSLYNLGDDFNLNITLSPANNAKGFFTAKLVCTSSITAGDVDVDALIESLEEETNETTNETEEETEIEEIIEESYGEIEIYKSPENILGGEKKVIQISTSLDSFFIGDLKGDCLISASYDDEVADSQTFGITQDININFGLNGYTYDPGESFEILGTATKGNGIPLEGFVTISVAGLGINISSMVEAGEFGASVLIPSNAVSGEYNVIVNAYEKDELDETINHGTAKDSIRVEQIVKDLGIALNSQSIIPGEDLIYTILLFDQAGSEVRKDVEVIIYDEKEEIYSEVLVESGVANNIPIGSNYTPGYWKIETAFEDLEARKAVYIEELETASFEMINGTLKITNIGNVPYNKPVEIKIGENSKVENVYLKIGESIEFELTAPDGEYEISVSDGDSSQNLGTTALTGRAISVRETGEKLLGGLWWLWIIIIIVIIAIIIYFFKRKKKTSESGDKKIIGESIAAKDATISGGKKEEASIISLKIKNSSELGESTGDGSPIESINKTLMKAKESNAKIYMDGDYRVIILSPLLTKKDDNTVNAVKIAQAIEKDLNTHNAKAEKKIEFGIGVNSGDMIVESKEGKFKFTSLGNTISLAKRISSASDSEVLLSEPLHRKSAGKIKSTKVPNENYWKVGRIIERGRHSAFIEKFKKRQEAGKK